MTSLALRQTPVRPARLLKAISQEVKPYRYPSLFARLPGIELEPIRDEVLLHLGTYADWREYEMMDRDPAVAGAWRHVETVLSRVGWEIQQGRSKSADAARFERYAELLLLHIPADAWPDILKRILDATKFGWRPLQVLPGDAPLDFEGDRVFFPARIVDKDPHHFRWSRDGKLVFLKTMAAAPKVFDPTAVKYGWLTPRYGTVDCAYGDRSLYQQCWLIWFAITQVRQAYFQGMERQFGMLKVTEKASRPRAEGQAPLDVRAIQEEISTIVEFLSSHNIALELGDWQVEVVTDLDFIDGGLKALQALETAFYLHLTGERLTSDPGDRGTQALGRVQERVRSDFALDLAVTIESTISNLFANWIELNFGEVDPRDLPRFTSRLRLQVDVREARQLFDMGAGLDAARLSELMGDGMESVVATGPAEDGQVILQKQPGASLQDVLAGLGGGPAAAPDDDDDTEGADDDDDRTLLEAIRGAQLGRGLTILAAERAAGEARRARLEKHLQPAIEDARSAASDPLAGYVVSMLDSFRAERAKTDPLAGPPCRGR